MLCLKLPYFVFKNFRILCLHKIIYVQTALLIFIIERVCLTPCKVLNFYIQYLRCTIPIFIKKKFHNVIYRKLVYINRFLLGYYFLSVKIVRIFLIINLAFFMLNELCIKIIIFGNEIREYLIPKKYLEIIYFYNRIKFCIQFSINNFSKVMRNIHFYITKIENFNFRTKSLELNLVSYLQCTIVIILLIHH